MISNKTYVDQITLFKMTDEILQNLDALKKF